MLQVHQPVNGASTKNQVLLGLGDKMRLPYGWEIRTWLTEKMFPGHNKSRTMEEWVEVRKTERKQKVRYFISDTIPSFFGRQKRKVHDVQYFFMYRFMRKHQYNRIDTGLKPAYYENDTRMLHGMFNVLKEYVEGELAHMQLWNCDEKDWKGEGRIEGLNCLMWQEKLIHGKDDGVAKNNKLYGKRTSQAITAQEIKELYLWWMDERPARKDPYDFYELDEDMLDKDKGIFESIVNRTPARKKADKIAYKKSDALEKKHTADDTKMLIRLIKVRAAMWT